jgi:hypothetical protein
MDPIDLTTRAEAGAALSSTQHDTNLANIQTKINALISLIGLISADDGTLKNGVIDVITQIADNLITLAKMAALGVDDRGKFLRANPSTGAIEAAAIYSAKETDSTSILSAGAQTGNSLSTFTFTAVPAGDVLIWVTVHGERQAGSNGGTVRLMQGSTSLVDIPTHAVDNGGWTVLPGFARIADFGGGDLSLEIEFETGEVDSSIKFGVDGDSRFGRHVMVVAGL